MAEALADPVGLVAALQVALPEAAEFPRLIQAGEQLSDELTSRSRKGTALLRKLVGKVRLTSGEVLITLHSGQVANLLQLAPEPSTEDLCISAPASLRRRGGGMKLVLPSGRAATPTVDLPLLQLIHRGRQWWCELHDEPGLTLNAIGRREGLTGGYVLRLVRLAFLDPTILRAILSGETPVQLSIDALTGPRAISPRWADQKREFGIVPAS